MGTCKRDLTNNTEVSNLSDFSYYTMSDTTGIVANNAREAARLSIKNQNSELNYFSTID